MEETHVVVQRCYEASGMLADMVLVNGLEHGHGTVNCHILGHRFRLGNRLAHSHGQSWPWQSLALSLGVALVLTLAVARPWPRLAMALALALAMALTLP